MQDSDPLRTRSILNIRAEFAQIAIFALFLAIGTGLLADQISNAVGSSAYSTAFGLVLIIVPIAFVVTSARSKLNWEIDIESILVTNSKSNMPMAIFRYEFSEEMQRNIKAICVENEAIKKTIDSTDIFLPRGEGDDAKLRDRKISKSGLIIQECMEYYIINIISTTLESYFNDDAYDNEKIVLGRKDMSDILLENRFIDLFSKPIEDRHVFMDNHKKKFSAQIMRYSDDEPQGTIIFATSDNGEIFNLFEITLPKGGRIQKTKNGELVICTKFFTITIDSKISQFDTSLEAPFVKFYMNKKSDEIKCSKFITRIDVKFHARAILNKSAWKYHKWIDELILELSDKLDFDKFIDKIKWDYALTMIVADINRDRQAARGKRSTDPKAELSSPNQPQEDQVILPPAPDRPGAPSPRGPRSP